MSAWTLSPVNEMHRLMCYKFCKHMTFMIECICSHVAQAAAAAAGRTWNQELPVASSTTRVSADQVAHTTSWRREQMCASDPVSPVLQPQQGCEAINAGLSIVQDCYQFMTSCRHHGPDDSAKASIVQLCNTILWKVCCEASMPLKRYTP